MDGFGFHEGYFQWSRSVRKKALPKGVNGYALRAFDQGLGRSLWFVECADIAESQKRSKRFRYSAAVIYGVGSVLRVPMRAARARAKRKS